MVPVCPERNNACVLVFVFLEINPRKFEGILGAKNMKDAVLSLTLGIARRTMMKVGQYVWDGTWNMIIQGIAEAEGLWEESGRGKEKKKYVIEKAIEYIEKNVRLNFITRRIMVMFVSRVVDAILDQLNEEIGTNWAEQVEDLQAELAGKIPFIK